MRVCYVAPSPAQRLQAGYREGAPYRVVTGMAGRANREVQHRASRRGERQMARMLTSRSCDLEVVGSARPWQSWCRTHTLTCCIEKPSALMRAT